MFRLFVCLIALVASLSVFAEETLSTNKLEKKISKLLSEKNQQKAMKKINKNLTAEKKAEMVALIAESKLTDSQKVGLVEALENAEETIDHAHCE